jgi:hypothetical protein
MTNRKRSAPCDHIKVEIGAALFCRMAGVQHRRTIAAIFDRRIGLADAL